jgi:hypothetical protein
MREGGKARDGAAMRTVSAPPARKSHLKKFAKASFAIIPLKRACGVGGCAARKSAATPNTARAEKVRSRARSALFCQAMSARKSASVPIVSTNSGRNQLALRRFSATR